MGHQIAMEVMEAFKFKVTDIMTQGGHGPLMIVGEQPVVLFGNYEPDQLWFPFMQGCAFRAPAPEKKAPQSTLPKINLTRVYAKVPESARKMYRYEEGNEQHVLPFEEHRFVTTKERVVIAHAKYPAWPRTQDGKPLRISFPKTRKDELKAWARENARGRVAIHADYAVFSDKQDAAMARLMFEP